MSDFEVNEARGTVRVFVDEGHAKGEGFDITNSGVQFYDAEGNLNRQSYDLYDGVPLLNAAPDLLEALRHAYNVLHTFHNEDVTNEVMVQAYEAIRKAGKA